MSKQRWYAHIEGEVRGPFSPSEIKKYASMGAVRPDTKLCPVGSYRWIDARLIEGIFPPPAVTAPSPLIVVSNVSEQAVEPTQRIHSASTINLSDPRLLGSNSGLNRAEKLVVSIVGTVLIGGALLASVLSLRGTNSTADADQRTRTAAKTAQDPSLANSSTSVLRVDKFQGERQEQEAKKLEEERRLEQQRLEGQRLEEQRLREAKAKEEQLVRKQQQEEQRRKELAARQRLLGNATLEEIADHPESFVDLSYEFTVWINGNSISHAKKKNNEGKVVADGYILPLTPVERNPERADRIGNQFGIIPDELTPFISSKTLARELKDSIEPFNPIRVTVKFIVRSIVLREWESLGTRDVAYLADISSVELTDEERLWAQIRKVRKRMTVNEMRGVLEFLASLTFSSKPPEGQIESFDIILRASEAVISERLRRESASGGLYQFSTAEVAGFLTRNFEWRK